MNLSTLIGEATEYDKIRKNYEKKSVFHWEMKGHAKVKFCMTFSINFD